MGDRMKALTRVASVCGVAALATGCATQWPTQQEEVQVWLSEAPRTVAVKTAPELPTSSVRVRDHRAGERVGQGVKGALGGAGMSLYAGCVGGGAENASGVPAVLGAPTEYSLGTSGHPWRMQVSPLATDKLTLPAGTFDAVRVEVAGERAQTSFAGLAGGLWNTMEVTRFKF